MDIVASQARIRWLVSLLVDNFRILTRDFRHLPLAKWLRNSVSAHLQFSATSNCSKCFYVISCVDYRIDEINIGTLSVMCIEHVSSVSRYGSRLEVQVTISGQSLLGGLLISCTSPIPQPINAHQ